MSPSPYERVTVNLPDKSESLPPFTLSVECTLTYSVENPVSVTFLIVRISPSANPVTLSTINVLEDGDTFGNSNEDDIIDDDAKLTTNVLPASNSLRVSVTKSPPVSVSRSGPVLKYCAVATFVPFWKNGSFGSSGCVPENDTFKFTPTMSLSVLPNDVISVKLFTKILLTPGSTADEFVNDADTGVFTVSILDEYDPLIVVEFATYN